MIAAIDTDEALAAFARQQWLRDQGFSYRVTSAGAVMDSFAAHLSRGAERRGRGRGDDDGGVAGGGGNGRGHAFDDIDGDEEDDDDDVSTGAGGGGGAGSGGGEDASRRQPCPVPSNRWVCIAAQSGQHADQRGRPTQWQARVVDRRGSDEEIASAGGGGHDRASRWCNLPPSLSAGLESAFVAGAGLLHVGMPSNSSASKAQQAAAVAAAAAHRKAHLVVPAVRGVVQFDAVDVTRSNGVLHLLNDAAARAAGSIFPEMALPENLVATAASAAASKKMTTASTTTTGAGGGAARRTRLHQDASAAPHANQHSHLPMPAVDLTLDGARRLCETLQVDPALFVALADEDDLASIVYGGRSSSNVGRGSTAKSAASGGGGGAVSDQQQQQQQPVTLSLRIRRFGDVSQHSCDVNNPSSPCVAALVQRIRGSDTSGIHH